MDTNAAILAGIILRAKAQIVQDALAGHFAARPEQGKPGTITCYPRER